MSTINSVVINGVAYVPEMLDVGEPSNYVPFVDCDSNNVVVGERVYVRESALSQYPNLTGQNRHGILSSGNNDNDANVQTLTIWFDGGKEFTFPRSQVRRNPAQQ